MSMIRSAHPLHLVWAGTIAIIGFFAFIHVSFACSLESGKPYKHSGHPGVYLVTTNCEKIPMKNSKIFFSHFDSWDEITVVPEDRLESVPHNTEISFVPWGPKKQFEEGTIVKPTNDGTAYIMLNNALYPIASEDVAKELGLEITAAEAVDPAVLQKYTTEKPIEKPEDYPAALVFKYPDSPHVYMMERQEDGSLAKRYIESFDLLKSHYRIDRIAVLPPMRTFAESPHPPIGATATLPAAWFRSDPSSRALGKDMRGSAPEANGPALPPGALPPGASGPTAEPESDTGFHFSFGGSGGSSGSAPAAGEASLIDLTVTSSVAVAEGYPTTTLTFTFVYTNTGNTAAPGTVLSTTVPNNTTFITVSSTSGWACTSASRVRSSVAGSTCRLTLGAVSPLTGGVVTFTLTAASSFDGTITDTVTIATDGTDADTANNTAVRAIAIGGDPDLSVTMTADTSMGTASSTVLFTIAYANSGSATAPNTIVTETVPTGTVFMSAQSTGSWSCANGAAAGSSCTTSIGAVAQSGSGTRIFAVTVIPHTAGVSTNTVSIADDGTNGTDSVTSNNTATAAVTIGRIPLIDMGDYTYLGFSGGLYPNGSNSMPAAHDAAGRTFGGQMQLLDTSGNPSPSGMIVGVSIGITNADTEFSGFQLLARAHMASERNTYFAGNSTVNGQTPSSFDDATDANYAAINTARLGTLGYTEAQVQVAWLHAANVSPTLGLSSGSANADAYALQTSLGRIVRALKVRYPNLKQVYLSSLPYGGYAANTFPEPYSYETAFAVKWLIESQINQMANGGTLGSDTNSVRSGDLNYTNGTAPWIAWGPYLWANGTTENSEGLSWASADFQTGGVLINVSGRDKIARKLLSFFFASPHAPWFQTRTYGLADMGSRLYLGFSGGLYPNNENTPPILHHNEGVARGTITSTSTERIQPLDGEGGTDLPNKKIVFLAIGFSNNNQEFGMFQDVICSTFSYPGDETNPSGNENSDIMAPYGCAPDDPRINPDVFVVNGAVGGQTAETWDGSDSRTTTNLDRARGLLLTHSLTEAQVQVIWLKTAHASPSNPLSQRSATADAITLQEQFGDIVRVLKDRYPNLRQIFLASRTYGGYDTIGLNPEPYAYESGFTMKWLIESQINQMANGGTLGSDTNSVRSGDLNYTNGTAPWIAWGPYLWANGTIPNSDGLFWDDANVVNGVNLGDFRADDHIHPSLPGRVKVANKLLDFLLSSPYTSWFRAE